MCGVWVGVWEWCGGFVRSEEEEVYVIIFWRVGCWEFLVKG